MGATARLLSVAVLLASLLNAAPAYAGLTLSAKDPAECFYEGDAPAKLFRFKVLLSAAASKTVKVDYTTAQDGAKVGEDFTQTAGTLTFLAGQKAKTVQVPVVNDERNEKNFERLFLKLSNPRGASLADASAAGWICNDDPYPMIEDAGVSVAEGAVAQIPVSLTDPSGRKVTLKYETSYGGEDFTATSGTLVWPPDTTTQKIPVAIAADQIDETDESFVIGLYGGTNVGSPVFNTWNLTVTITDDDPLPQISVGDISLSEGSTYDFEAQTIPLTIVGQTEKAMEVKVSTSPGTAAADADYWSLSESLVMLPSDATLFVYADFDPEADETLTVTLSHPSNVSIGDASGVVTILDDD